MSDAKTPAPKKATELRPYETLIQEIARRAELDGVSSFDIAANVIDQISQATTFEEIVAANNSGPVDVNDYFGTPLTVTNVRFMKSAEQFRQGGLGHYALINALTDRGDELLLSTGAPNIVAGLYHMLRVGIIRPGEKDQRMSFQGRVTANGTLFFIDLPADAKAKSSAA
jgi:hypothetical protein